MNKIEPRTLSGFMELYPNEQIMFNKMKSVIEETYKKYGFYALDTPIIEYSNVLLAKAGGETEKQIYRFNKGDNDLSLRFDLTVPLAKYVAKRSNELVFPFKRYQIGKVFRGERPQKGRFREFYQCDIDVVGDSSLSLKYDAEMPLVIYDIFNKMNIGAFTVRINNRKILAGFFDSLGLSNMITEILRIIDKLEKIGIDNVKEELLKLNIDNNSINKILEFINISGSNEEKLNKLSELKIENGEYNKGIDELKEVVNNIITMGMNESNLEIDLTIARGLDYYTGTVYETKLNDYPEIGSICSGGRYDELAEFYTSKHLPGVGISIGLTRLFEKLKEVGIIKCNEESSSKVTIIPMTDNYKYINNISSILRKENIPTDVCYIEKGFKQKFRYADRQKVEYTIIIGDDEVNGNYITLKNMVTGNQDKYNVKDVIEILTK